LPLPDPPYMPTVEELIQKTVTSIEGGEIAKWIWRAVFTEAARIP